MRYWLLTAALLLTVSPGQAQKKSKEQKPPEIVLEQVSAKREDGKILVDVSVRNQSPKAISNLLVIIDFLSPDNEVLTTQKGNLDPADIEPGETAGCSAQINEQARITSYRVSFEDEAGHYFRSTKSGPFPVE